MRRLPGGWLDPGLRGACQHCASAIALVAGHAFARSVGSIQATNFLNSVANEKGGPSAAFPDNLTYWQRCIRPSSRRTIVPGWQMMPLRAA